MDPAQTAAAIGSGVVVGFTLGLVGGGGSILAVPLLLYVVGMPDPHLAIGTSAVAVAVNAFANLVPHAREQHVRWYPALVFAAAGLAGVFAGSSIGKAVDGRRLLILFALLMLFVAAMMLRGRKADTGPVGAERPVDPWRLGQIGLGIGSLSGFYGIGGGFFVVPGLILGTGMPTIAAIGSALVAVGVFGTTTAHVVGQLSVIFEPMTRDEFLLRIDREARSYERFGTVEEWSYWLGTSVAAICSH